MSKINVELTVSFAIEQIDEGEPIPEKDMVNSARSAILGELEEGYGCGFIHELDDRTALTMPEVEVSTVREDARAALDAYARGDWEHVRSFLEAVAGQA